MSADCVVYHGRFKTDKDRYEEIKNTLINGFIELRLEPDKRFDKKDVEGWKTLFEDKEEYLELYIDNCFGNWGDALDYIEKDFIKAYKDIQVEFGIVEYYGGANADGIIYDGKRLSHKIPDFVEILYEDEYYDEDYEDEEDDEYYEFEFDSVDELEFNGNIFVLSGLSMFDEEKIKNIILGESGVIKNSTVLKTKYLIVNQFQWEPTKKYNRAIELKEQGKQISIISVGCFYELYEKYKIKKKIEIRKNKQK